MTEKKPRPQLPEWLYPTPHAGWCYDQIGAASMAGGVIAGVAASSVEAAAQTLLDGQALQAAAFIPDPFVAAVTGVVTGLLSAAYLMYRHWLPHRALAAVLADCEHLQGELAEMWLAEQLDEPAELRAAAAQPMAALTGARQPLALVAGPGKEG